MPKVLENTNFGKYLNFWLHLYILCGILFECAVEGMQCSKMQPMLSVGTLRPGLSVWRLLLIIIGGLKNDF